MTIEEKALKYINQFETIKPDEGMIRVILKETADKKLQSAIREAHGDKLPNDFIYATFLEILEGIAGYNFDSIDALDECRSEIVDSLVDVYTNHLTEWLHEDINNVNYLDDAIADGATNGFELLSMAQYHAIDEVYPYVQELLND